VLAWPSRTSTSSLSATTCGHRRLSGPAGDALEGRGQLANVDALELVEKAEEFLFMDLQTVNQQLGLA
jgi:hypothetical protein